MKLSRFFLIVCAAALLGACEGAPIEAPGSGEPPTVSPLFAHNVLLEPTTVPAPAAILQTPGPSGQVASAAGDLSTSSAPSSNAPGDQLVEMVIYDDGLNPDWTLDNSWGAKVDPADPGQVYSGTVAAAVTPLEDYGAAFFSVKEGARATYPITEVVGVSLWINSGADYLDPDNLAVTVVGSNDYTYWTRDDKSVQLDDQTFFSESRLYYLGITRSLPPNQWAEAIVWLDKLPYEPDYKYVTGVYVKNDKDFRQTFYIDRVVLLLVQ